MEKEWYLRVTESDLFTRVDLDVMREIADTCCFEENHAAGKELFKEGDSAEDLYILEKGSVDLKAKGTVVATLSQKDDIFGWSSFIEGGRYTATAVCSTDIDVIRIAGGPLNRILSKRPDVGLVIFRRLAAVFNRRLSQIYRSLLG
jgi:CRP-like cAMP-binding protein